MHVELELAEIQSLIEALDCLKTKIAFTKGVTSAEKNDKIRNIEKLELKLSSGNSPE